MDKINFNNLPVRDTAVNAPNLNAMQSNIEKSVNYIGSNQPETTEKVWINPTTKEVFIKNDNGVFEKFYSEPDEEFYQETFQYENQTFYLSILRVGKNVNLKLESDASVDMSGTTIKIIPERFKPRMEMSFPVTNWGNLIGTGWLDTSGNIKLITQKAGFTRIYVSYII